MAKKTRTWTDYFQYLDDLRESGRTNMWGAGAYLEQAFGLERREASEITGAWMKTFNTENSAFERARTALAEKKP